MIAAARTRFWTLSGKDREPDQGEVADGRRQLRRSAAVRRGQLLDEEGIAVGPGDDPLHQIGRCLDRQQPGEQLRRLCPIQPAEVDTLAGRRPLHLAQPAQQRIVIGQLVRAAGQDDQQPATRRTPDEQAQQVAGRPVAPLNVLDPEHDRLARSRPIQQADQFPEEATGGRRCGCVAVRRPGQIGNQPAQLNTCRVEPARKPLASARREKAQRVRDGRVRQLAHRHRRAATDQHHGAPPHGRLRELVQASSLAHARFAEHHDRVSPALGGAIKGGLQAGHLIVPANQPSRHRAPHSSIVGDA